jgi:hypothetical protein
MFSPQELAIWPLDIFTDEFHVTFQWVDFGQGWVCDDDYIKPRGQVTSAKTTSYMAQPSDPLLPSSCLLDLVLRSTNEMRLQELYELYHRRKLISPGPGEHDVRPMSTNTSIPVDIIKNQPSSSHTW